MDIELDGANIGSYTQPLSSPNGEDYSYNVPVYANSNVGAGQHTLRIMAKTDSSTFETLLFDYAVYTYVNILHFLLLLLKDEFNVTEWTNQTTQLPK